MKRKVKILLAFGSNLGDKKENIEKAYAELSSNCINIIKKSDYYENPAYGVCDQPDFVNSAAVCETDLTPRELLKKIKKIEMKVGRTETFRWGPRVIDIDIVFYDQIIYKSLGLEIPHKDYKNRDFVTIPAESIINDEWNIDKIGN